MLAGNQQQINLQHELNKFIDLGTLGLLTQDFLLGYIAAYMGRLPHKQQWLKIKQKIENISSIAKDKLITQNNLIELVQVGIIQGLEGNQLKGKKKGIDVGKFLTVMDKNLNELVIDQKYLHNKFYREDDLVVPVEVRKHTSKLGLQCPICCQQITHSTVCPIACGHNLHKQCFQQYFKTQVSVKKFPILCPQEGCSKEINVSDIQQYITGEPLEKYFQFSLHVFVDKNKTTNWCPTAGCSAIFQMDFALSQYECPSCRKKYCLKCKSEFHQGYTCEQYMEMRNLKPEDQQFLDFAKGAHFKQCPSCKFWVEKNKGCDHMTCRCGHEFCYKCGAEYGTCDCQESDYSDYDDEEF